MSSIFYIQTDIIHFSARGLKNKSPVKTETLIFTTIMSNEGSGYNDETGVFTAPVGGLYMFNLQLCILNNKHLHFEIVANGQTIGKRLAIDDSGHSSSCDSYSISTILKAKDTVSVKACRKSSGLVLWDSHETWNTFDGFLVQRD